MDERQLTDEEFEKEIKSQYKSDCWWIFWLGFVIIFNIMMSNFIIASSLVIVLIYMYRAHKRYFWYVIPAMIKDRAKRQELRGKNV